MSAWGTDERKMKEMKEEGNERRGEGNGEWEMAMHYWAYRVKFLGDKCESMFRDNLFPSAYPSFPSSLPSLLALLPTFLSPRGLPHLLFSGEVKNSKPGGRRWGRKESTWKWSKWRNVFREFSQVLIKRAPLIRRMCVWQGVGGGCGGRVRGWGK